MNPESLEQELQRISLAIERGRNSELILKLWGWAGSGPRTLDSVGREMGLTRERVRQIEARALKRLQALNFSTPYLDASIAKIHSLAPASIHSLIEELLDANLIRGRFEIKGIEAAAERLGRNWSLNELVIGGGAFLVAANDFERYSKIHSVIRRRTSSSGCLNLLTLAADLEVNDSKIDKLRSLVDAMPEVAWLDSERTWFFATDSARNRLFNLVSKVLGVCTRIRVGELRRAVSRSRRLAVAPPQNILGHFVEAAKLGHLEGTFVVANPENVSPPEVGTAEATLLQVLDQFGPVLAGEEFAERCVSAGMNATTFYIYRLISPLVSSLGRGVYCKVGADIAPGTVEEIQSRRASMARASDHGWTQKGMLWFGLEVSLSVITAGSITLDSFVADLAQGEWTVDLPGGGAVDKVLCKGRFIWSFRRSLTLLGTEPGDVIILEFDTRARRIGLRVGGMELLEAAQEGSDLSIEAEDPGS